MNFVETVNDFCTKSAVKLKLRFTYMLELELPKNSYKLKQSSLIWSKVIIDCCTESLVIIIMYVCILCFIQMTRSYPWSFWCGFVIFSKNTHFPLVLFLTRMCNCCYCIFPLLFIFFINLPLKNIWVRWLRLNWGFRSSGHSFKFSVNNFLCLYLLGDR